VTSVAHGRLTSRSGRAIRWAFTGRAGGVSQGPFASLNLAAHVGDDPQAVQANRDLAGSLVDVGPGNLAVADAVHGAHVAEVMGPGDSAGADGLVTAEAGIGLLALAADCVPMALLDVEQGVIGAVHCGWKGIGAGIVPATVERLRAMGAGEVQAVIGPYVCVTCYPAEGTRVEELRRAVDPAVARASCIQRDGRWHIDVGAGVCAQLAQLGVEVQVIPRCTVEDPDLFSYRRDRVTGRHGVLVSIQESG